MSVDEKETFRKKIDLRLIRQTHLHNKADITRKNSANIE